MARVAWPFTTRRIAAAPAETASVVNKAFVALIVCLTLGAATISLSTTELHSIPGAPPDLVHPPPACRFHPRCPDAMTVCAETWPPTVAVGTARRSECWLHAMDEIPAGHEAPLEREALGVAEEA